MKKVTGCIVTYNNQDTIRKCIASILKETVGVEFTLYISDNGSMDRTLDIIRSDFPKVHIIENHKNGGFGYGHNQVLDMLDSDYHVVINPDVYLKSDAITVLCTYLEKHPSVGMIAPKVLNLDGSLQHLPKCLPSIRYVYLSKIPGFKKYRRLYTRADEHFTVPTSVKYCSGSFFVMPTALFKALGGFDERYFLYCEDADLCRQVLKSYKVIYDPEASIYHEWHRDNVRSLKGILRFVKSQTKYFMKWGWRF